MDPKTTILKLLVLIFFNSNRGYYFSLVNTTEVPIKLVPKKAAQRKQNGRTHTRTKKTYPARGFHFQRHSKVFVWAERMVGGRAGILILFSDMLFSLLHSSSPFRDLFEAL